MCLIAFAWRAHPDYDLVLAANRDEFHARPSEVAHAWPDYPGIFAGRDTEAGGAWCGVSTPAGLQADLHGRFAAVTNYRDMQPPKPGLKSRGWLVRDYLAGTLSARDYCLAIEAEKDDYAGFNLLVGDSQDLFYLGNRAQGSMRGIIGVPPGVHGLSNGVLGDVWPKTQRASQAISLAIGPAEIETEALFDLLKDERTATYAELPDTGVGQPMEKMLSPVFVRSPKYGTRASTVILRGNTPNGTSLRFIERSFNAQGECTNEVDQQWL